MFAELFEVQNNDFVEQGFCFGSGVCGGDSARQVRRIGGIAIVGFFDQDGVFHNGTMAVRSQKFAALPPHRLIYQIGIRKPRYQRLAGLLTFLGLWQEPLLFQLTAFKFVQSEFEIKESQHFPKQKQDKKNGYRQQTR